MISGLRRRCYARPLGGSMRLIKKTVTAVLVLTIAASPAIAKRPAHARKPAPPNHYVAPRAADGVHPDLNGVWQVLNTANWDIEPHPAKAALAFRPGPF